MLTRGLLSAFLCPLLVQAQAAPPGEYEVKAAFLYNFALYVEWPPSAMEGKAVVIASLGKDVFGGALEKTMKGRTAQGKPVDVRRFAGPDEVRPVHILFVPRQEAEHLPKIAEALRGSGTLIVAESPGAARRGAAVNFLLEDKRVRFEVNPDAAARQNLKLGAKVLRVARVVPD